MRRFVLLARRHVLRKGRDQAVSPGWTDVVVLPALTSCYRIGNGPPLATRVDEWLVLFPPEHLRSVLVVALLSYTPLMFDRLAVLRTSATQALSVGGEG